MAHEWEVVSLGTYAQILDEAVGRETDAYRCKRCGQIVTSQHGLPPEPRWVEDCDTSVVRQVLDR